MGYESKLYVVDRCVVGRERPFGFYADVIVVYDLCKMGWDSECFYNAFTQEIDFDLWVDGELVQEDCYGQHIKMAKPKDVVATLKEWKEKNKPYRRIDPLIAMLEAFDESQFEDLEVCHYGY